MIPDIDDIILPEFRNNPPACKPILHLVKRNFTGVEIGVYGASSSVQFLDNCKYMYLIDPYCPYPGYADRAIIGDSGDILYVAVQHYLQENFLNRFLLLRVQSFLAAELIPEVNFVFIDGNHAYGDVLSDMNLYWPKITPGGFLSGHDFSKGHEEVISAVQQFCDQHNVKYYVHDDCWVIWK